MKVFMSVRNIAAYAIISCLLVRQGNSQPARGVSASVIVTVADHLSHKPQPLRAEDIGHVSSVRITGITPLRGDSELFLLIDDAANYDFGQKLQELRSFVDSRPASVAIGVAFIRNGELSIAQPLTKDHQLADRALRAPSGSKPANPYCALSSLIDSWSGSERQREVVMVASGIDYSVVGSAVCANAETAIADAQRAGVIVYAIYHPAADYEHMEWRQVDRGVVDLAHVCYETGGEAYFITHSPMENIGLFLGDIAEHLMNQYVVNVVIDPMPGSDFQHLLIYPQTAGLDLMAPAGIWLKAKNRSSAVPGSKR
jgi:hypothetical protein